MCLSAFVEIKNRETRDRKQGTGNKRQKSGKDTCYKEQGYNALLTAMSINVPAGNKSLVAPIENNERVCRRYTTTIPYIGK
jgi:hypothetical protein